MSRREGLDRLRRTMTEHGATEGRDDGSVPMTGRIVPDERPQDVRPPNVRCAICCRTIDPRRKLRVPGHPDYFGCGYCIGVDRSDEHPVVLAYWLPRPTETKRQYIRQHHGIDPVTAQVIDDPTVEFASTIVDADGVPATVRVETVRQRVPTVGIPKMFWDVAAERGWVS
jgi:hypothetical protein